MQPSANFLRGLAAVKKANQLIETGSKEHAALLESGYGMNEARAKEIVKLGGENPLAFPYEVRQKAAALLEALKTKPVPISKNPGWKRDTEHRFFGEAAR